MADQKRQDRLTGAPSASASRIKIGVMPLFSTWIYVCEDGPRDLNERLEQLAHRLMQNEDNTCRRTNCGGWHYGGDFFKLEEPIVAEFRHEMEQHIQAFVNYFRPEAGKKKDRFRLEGWINVNREGDYNVLHYHP